VGDAGVVHQDIDPAPGVDHPGHGLPAVLRSGDVATNRASGPAIVPDPLRGIIGRISMVFGKVR
jgi:hypothetical protein